ncbi:MAG: hypothetical protein WKF84_24725 [Pyrinomonadaceae bacterium]
MRARLQGFLGREPTMVELGIFSVMWSEHCSYKSSRVHLKRLPTTGEKRGGAAGRKTPASLMWATAWCAAFKSGIAQPHPSFIEPFSGRRDRRRRHSTRHLHDGRAAHRGDERRLRASADWIIRGMARETARCWPEWFPESRPTAMLFGVG